MIITYRRTGGLFMLLTLAIAALAATVLTVAVAGILLIVAAVALFGRAVLPRRWRHRTIPAVTGWPQDTIDATVVNAISFSDTPKLLPLDDHTR
jgi:hypothetical protein